VRGRPSRDEELFWQWVGNHNPLGFIDVTLDPHAKPIEAMAGELWRDLGKRIPADSTTLWLAIKP
jgi:hypothetical protein